MHLAALTSYYLRRGYGTFRHTTGPFKMTSVVVIN